MNPTIKKIYREISLELGISEKKVEEIVENQFLFVKDTMKKGIKNNPESFKNVQLTHLGKFAVRQYKLKEYQKMHERSKRKDRGDRKD